MNAGCNSQQKWLRLSKSCQASEIIHTTLEVMEKRSLKEEITFRPPADERQYEDKKL